MQQGISNPDLYGDLVYKFKKIIGNPNFSDLFKCIVNKFKRAWYTLDIKRHNACHRGSTDLLLLQIFSGVV